MKLELKYFDFLGRGEAIRIMLHGAYGSGWTDTRIQFSQWSNVKPSTPLGSVPILNIDGTNFVQSVALNRYAAKLVNMYPTDPLQALVVDETMDMISELITKIPKGESDDVLKPKRQEFQQTVMKRYFDLMESRIQQFSNDTKTICGIPSVADVHLLAYKRTLDTGQLSYIDPTMFNEYPGITGVVQAITKHPIVVSYDSAVAEESKE